MKASLLACAVVAMAILAALAHAVVIDPKPLAPIQILHLPRLLLAGADLGFQVRIRGAVDADRIVFAMLCVAGEMCSTRVLEHERWSELPIEGSSAPKLWAPKPWGKLPEGNYLFVAGIGPEQGVRFSEQLSVSVHGF